MNGYPKRLFFYITQVGGQTWDFLFLTYLYITDVAPKTTWQLRPQLNDNLFKQWVAYQGEFWSAAICKWKVHFKTFKTLWCRWITALANESKTPVLCFAVSTEEEREWWWEKYLIIEKLAPSIQFKWQSSL